MKIKKFAILTKLLMLAVAVYVLIQLASLQTGIHAAERTEQQLRQQAAYAEQERRQLEEKLSELGSDSSTIKIARERLGMVEEGEIVFYDSDS